MIILDFFRNSDWQYTTRLFCEFHDGDVIRSAMAYQITSLTIVYSIAYSDAYEINHQGSASLAFVRGIHRWPVNSPHKEPVTREMFPFDDVIMLLICWQGYGLSHDPMGAFWVILSNTLLRLPLIRLLYRSLINTSWNTIFNMVLRDLYGIFVEQFWSLLSDIWLTYLLWICPWVIVTGPHRW